MKKSLSSNSPNKWVTPIMNTKAPATVTQKLEKVILCPPDHDQNLMHQKHFEDELMGHKEGEGQIGDSIERNMNQMVDVLRSKISAMGKAAKMRIRLCEEDLKKNSKESSDQAPKMMEDFDESSNVRGARDTRYGVNSHKDNLVSAEGVFIDAAHLVIRTKATTDAAKKLELELEESFASSSLRDMKKMRGKIGLSRTEKSKKSEQKRFEAKKVMRNRSEKDLQTNMENFLTRSVMDTDLYFKAPTLSAGHIPNRRRSTAPHAQPINSYEVRNSHSQHKGIVLDEIGEQRLQGEVDTEGDAANEDDYMESFDEEVQSLDPVRWPITIKWPQKDPRSAHPDNGEGEMDPALLLRYSVEKINLPSGENMFRWLGRQSTIQQYFVYLFWLVKVKFFERDSDPENESFLLRGLSAEYVKIMELLASHGHGAEYEKDFAYQYLPYILANAVYFGFFFLCPGSRHIYTKGFKKTILLQVVKVMHGLQLCTASVKVLWVRLFPEDTHEVEDDAEDIGEIFPVQIAVGNEAKYFTHTAGHHETARTSRTAVIFAAEESNPSNRTASADSAIQITQTLSKQRHSSLPTPSRAYMGQLAGVEEGNEQRQRESYEGTTGPWAPTEHLSSLSKKTKTRLGLTRKPPSQTADKTFSPQHLVLSSDMQYQWDDRESFLRPANMVAQQHLSLQNVMRRNSCGSDPIPKFKCRRRNSDMSANDPFASKRLRAPITLPLPAPLPVPDLQTIMSMYVDPTAVLVTDPAPVLAPVLARPIPISIAIPTAGTSRLLPPETAMRARSPAPVPAPGTLGLPSSATVRPSCETMRTRTGPQDLLEGSNFSSSSSSSYQADHLNPLARTLLKSTSCRHSSKLTSITRRQSTETVNMKSVSPLMQEYFSTLVRAPVKMTIGAQMMHRTVPVSWCATGGADTHRKRVVHTELYQDITDKRKEAEKEFLRASYMGSKNRLLSLRHINTTCQAVLTSDAATIGRFSLDLVKRQQLQRKVRASGPKGDFSHVKPLEPPSGDMLSANDTSLVANFDPADLDIFLASI